MGLVVYSTTYFVCKVCVHRRVTVYSRALSAQERLGRLKREGLAEEKRSGREEKSQG
jgi:hypothetical protein